MVLVVAVAALAYLGMQLFSGPKRPMNPVYFYNEKTKTLFADSDRLVPPIKTESRPGTGVRAYVYSCDNLNSRTERFIAFLEKMTPEGQQAAAKALINDKSGIGFGLAMDKLGSSFLVRSPRNETWYPKTSAEGAALMEAGMKSGGCLHPILCLP